MYVTFLKFLKAKHHDMMHSYNGYSPNAMSINNLALSGIKVAQRIMKEKLANDPNAIKVLSSLNAPEKFCPFKASITCDLQYPYRKLDGSCNNLKMAWWGQSEKAFKRWLKPEYSDGIAFLNDIFI